MEKTLENILKAAEELLQKGLRKGSKYSRDYLQQFFGAIIEMRELQELPEIPEKVREKVSTTLWYSITKFDDLIRFWEYLVPNLQILRKILGDEEFISMLDTMGGELIKRKHYWTVFQFFEVLEKYSDLSEHEKFKDRMRYLKKLLVDHIKEDIFIEYIKCWDWSLRVHTLERKLKAIARIVDLMEKYIMAEKQLGIKADKNFIKKYYKKLMEKEREVMESLKEISSKILSVHEDTRELRDDLDINELLHELFSNVNKETYKVTEKYYKLLDLWLLRIYNHKEAEEKLKTSEEFESKIEVLGHILGINRGPYGILGKIFFPGHTYYALTDELNKAYAECENIKYVWKRIKEAVNNYARRKLQEYLKGNTKEPPKYKEILEFVSKTICKNIEFWFEEVYVKRKEIIKDFLSKESKKEQ